VSSSGQNLSSIGPNQCFLSYARPDRLAALRLYQELRRAGIPVWIDQESLRPGERWRVAIVRAIKESRYFVPLLSTNSVDRRGYFQREIREAVEILKEFPEEDVYLIPVRLDDCRPEQPELAELNWVDLFPSWEDGLARLIRFIAPVREVPGGNLRFDGLYATEHLFAGETVRFRQYLRFYEDGTLISVSATGEPGDVLRWFEREHDRVGSGRYRTDGAYMEASIQFESGSVDLRGVAGDQILVLDFHSHINGNRGVREYHFQAQGA
jgi:hypothetical protein